MYHPTMQAAALSKPRPILRSRWLWLSIVLVFPAPAFSAEEPITPASFAETGIKTVDTTRDYVSQRFVSFITDVDHFFGDTRNFQETNRSVLQLDLNELMQTGGNRQARLALKAKLRLPSTEQRLHLLLESDPEKNATGGDTTNQTTPISQVATPEKYGVAVRYEKEKEDVWHYSSDFGVRVQTPVQPFVRARVSRAIPLDSWRMKVAQSLFWFSQPGAGETTQIDIEHLLGESALFRATSTATWMHQLQRFDLRQDFSVYHTLDEKRAVMYQTSAIGVDRPLAQVNDYVLSLTYRQQLHRRWLYFEVNPQLHFPHDRNFQLTPLLILRLEILFDAI